ncbi:hypothetical protein DSO57_1001041 [Entomophthora muscae]|uniref:Uncharacterized protein n=1 Tax=Entomophthora muscae TaxID=34485 RepID=A0ACC2UVD8_9FUNG|nr:hypothetical protein DSO57_1001041 [Entomophthora muscae]
MAAEGEGRTPCILSCPSSALSTDGGIDYTAQCSASDQLELCGWPILGMGGSILGAAPKCASYLDLLWFGFKETSVRDPVLALPGAWVWLGKGWLEGYT